MRAIKRIISHSYQLNATYLYTCSDPILHVLYNRLGLLTPPPPTHTLTVFNLEYDWLVFWSWGDPGEDGVGHREDLKRVVGVRELAEEGKVPLEQRADLYSKNAAMSLYRERCCV